MRAETIKERYERIGGFTHGFDYLRLILAVAVLAMHTLLSTYGDAYLGTIFSSWGRMFIAPILPMFFALSGFLVSGSLKKNPTVTSFVTLRAVRLVPALAVEIALSALILGPLFTTVPLGQYFTSDLFARYFLNIVGYIHYDLPGVFTTLPFPNTVNISLWTIPYELECYVLLMVLYIAGFIRVRARLLAGVALLVVVGSVIAFHEDKAFWAHKPPLPRSLVVAFLVGVVINLYADRVRLSWGLAAVATATMAVTILYAKMIFIAVVPAAYLAVFVGMLHPPKRSFLFSGDYSYGLYLFAFPIQQSFTALFPGVRLWWANGLFALVLGMLYAGFSWWCVEKPVLSRKHHAVRAAEGVRDRLLGLLRLRRHGHAKAVGDRVG